MKAFTSAVLSFCAALGGTPAAQGQSAPPLRMVQIIDADESDWLAGRDYNFGVTLDCDGKTLAVGLGDGPGPGAVAIFTRDSGGNWSRTATLVPSDSSFNDMFGRGVAIDGNTVLATRGTRELYLFERRGGVWRQRQKLSLGESESIQRQVDLKQRVAAVATVDRSAAGGAGMATTVVLERRRNGMFKRTATLRPSGDVESFRESGHSIALDQSGDRLLIGVPEEAADQGAAYLFRSRGDRWVEQQKLIAINGQPGDRFGFSVDLDHRVALIGAPPARSPDTTYRIGTGYVFARHGGLWQEQYSLRPTPEQWSAPLGALGYAVTIMNDSFVISAPLLFPGAVFAYERNLWQPLLKATAEYSSFLGVALGSTRTTLFAGAPAGPESGLVIVYDTAAVPEP
jgi:hypothetical protein